MSFVAAAVGAVGLGTSIYGDIKAHDTQKKLEKAQSPAYTPSQSIADYYAKALQRYSINPFQSATYQQSLQNTQSQQSSALNNLQGRREGVAGAGAIVQGSNNALLGATANAQQQQAGALGQLGQAAGAQTQQQEQAFNINQTQPFERNYNLLAMKAAGANQLANSGLQTFNSGLNSVGQQMSLRKYFGTNSNNGGSAPYNLGGGAGAVYAQQGGQNLSGFNPQLAQAYNLQPPAV